MQLAKTKEATESKERSIDRLERCAGTFKGICCPLPYLAIMSDAHTARIRVRTTAEFCTYEWYGYLSKWNGVIRCYDFIISWARNR